MMAPIRRRQNNNAPAAAGAGDNNHHNVLGRVRAGGVSRPAARDPPASNRAEREGEEVLPPPRGTNGLLDTGSSEIKFSVSLATETKSIIFIIQNFKALATIKDGFKNVRLFFDAGESIGIPSKWTFFLRREDDELGLYLRLVENLKDTSVIFAKYDTLIRRGPPSNTEFVKLSTEVIDMNSVADWGWSCVGQISRLLASSVLVDDELKLNIKFKMYARHMSQSEVPGISRDALTLQWAQSMIGYNQNALADKERTDVIIRTEEGEEIHAHKHVLSAHSAVLRTMFGAPMVEEATGILKINDIGSRAMKVIIHFMYTSEVDPSWKEVCAEVVYGADKYEVLLLKEYCDKTLVEACTNDNAMELLKLARLHNLAHAKEAIAGYVKSNIDGVISAAST